MCSVLWNVPISVCWSVLSLRQLYFLLFYWEVWQKCYMFHFVAGNKVLYFFIQQEAWKWFLRHLSRSTASGPSRQFHQRENSVRALSIKCTMTLFQKLKWRWISSPPNTWYFQSVLNASSFCTSVLFLLTVYKNTINIWIFTPSKRWKANNPSRTRVCLPKRKSPPACFSVRRRTIPRLSMMHRCWTMMPSGAPWIWHSYWEKKINVMNLLLGSRVQRLQKDRWSCTRAAVRSWARSELEWDSAMSPSAATCCNRLVLNVKERCKGMDNPLN